MITIGEAMGKYTKFKNSGSAPSYQGKYGDTKFKATLTGMKQTLKAEKSLNQITKKTKGK